MRACAAAAAFVAFATLAEAFTPAKVGRALLPVQRVSTLPDATPVAAPAVAAPKKNRLHVQIGNAVYDLTGWRAKHPAGSHWIDRFHQKDATDVIYAFHSDEAMQMFERLPRARGVEAVEPDATTLKFRELRAKLVADGWFKREWQHEAFLLVAQMTQFAVGVALARSGHVLAGTCVLGVAHTTCGWLAHDFIHGRGKWPSFMRYFGCLTVGLGAKWWSEKHNLHHAFTNLVGVDEDIMVEPALYLWSPTEERDKPWRKFQHFLWPVPFSALFAMWRIDSIKTALKLKLWPEIVALSLHYVALLALVGPGVALGHIMLGGLLTATIVTVTHTAEEMLMDDEMSFVEAQFRTTRDAKCTDPLSEYVWGGMQYQLEHHLFPTLPRYKYARLVPVIKQWAAENGLEYRVTGAWKIIADNVNQLKRVAAQPTDANSPSPNSA
ncbi:fatty acid desaturase [Tribonema minus]|uniref:Fatty acid desaturase n=1 Tax=Tribonema minus TaxID=303371 RepID=A0A836CAU7_9STRA|nr:fatty acid desaturase [Tribonema minus]